MSELKMERANKAFATLCEALDARNWKYEKVEKDLLVHFTVNGEDLPMQFIIFVDADRQLIRLLSNMPFNMSEDKRIEGAIATCHATYGLRDGSFDYDLSDGQIVFRMTSAFLDNEIPVSVIQYLIDFACTIVDKYNDQFFAINKGFLTIEKFLEA